MALCENPPCAVAQPYRYCPRQGCGWVEPPQAPAWFKGAVYAYDDAAGMGFDPWDPATSYWQGYVKAVANATGRTIDDITTEVRIHVTGR